MQALLLDSPLSITQIAVGAGITQPAATQTVALMIREGILSSEPSAEDSRQKLISLTKYGNELVPRLQMCWDATTSAADSLDRDLPFPISELLELAIQALGREEFGKRIEKARITRAAQPPRRKQTRSRGSKQ